MPTMFPPRACVGQIFRSIWLQIEVLLIKALSLNFLYIPKGVSQNNEQNSKFSLFCGDDQ